MYDSIRMTNVFHPVLASLLCLCSSMELGAEDFQQSDRGNKSSLAIGTEAKVFAAEAIDTRQSAIHQIEIILNGFTDCESLANRVKLQEWASILGGLHSDQASRLLIRHLTVLGGTNSNSVPLTAYPFAYELSRLGSVAYAEIFRQLDQPCTALQQKIIAHVCYHIDGSELAQMRLKIALRDVDSEHIQRTGYERSSLFKSNASQVIAYLSDKHFIMRSIE